MNKKVTVIIPTIGNKYLINAIESCLNQTYENIEVYVVCDGIEYSNKVLNLLKSINFFNYKNCKLTNLDDNVGKNGFYGHAVYAAFSYLVNCDYIVYLDEDNWFDKDHIQTLVETLENNNHDWVYSLRKIVDIDGNYVCNDIGESVGKYQQLFNYRLVDTSCYLLKKEIAVKSSWAIYGKWGMDRIFYDFLELNYPKFDTSGKFTLNYRLESSETSPKKEFFISSSNFLTKYPLPWENRNEV